MEVEMHEACAEFTSNQLLGLNKKLVGLLVIFDLITRVKEPIIIIIIIIIHRAGFPLT